MKTVRKVTFATQRDEVHLAVDALLDGFPCHPLILRWLQARQTAIHANERANYYASRIWPEKEHQP